ncbi:hypothetical protein A3F66_01715 [candidate division TM6 bacterium RIFCSPHIGHO2_12_FULL_32_22]|nr:MAG: hypothetical protein A3F66_01715 [candidate division TM6 bacterium RIFCSPHIGHO2_12_FULL_32_22]
MFDYSYKALPEKVVVTVSSIGIPEDWQKKILIKLNQQGEKYGFSVACVKGNEDFNSQKNGELNLLICKIGTPYKEDIVEKLSSYLKRYQVISLAFTYSSFNEMMKYREHIEMIKRKFDDKINFLRPDSVNENNMYYVSDEKILDNAVCDSVRVKYQPKNLNRTIVELGYNQFIKDFFIMSSTLYEKWNLYHRSSTDGYFAIRSNNGFFITATKTNKVNLDFIRISFVHSYDEKNNVLEFSGEYLPSSDAVEASIVFKNLPNVSSIIHTHASDLFTRNISFSDRVLVPRLPYGEPDLGYAIVKALNAVSDGFIIMDNHGEIFANYESTSHSFLEHKISFQCLKSLGDNISKVRIS